MGKVNSNFLEVTEESNDLARKIIGASIEVHRVLGMSLKSQTYERCLMVELDDLGIQYEQNVEIPVHYKNRLVEVVVVPLLVNNCILVNVQADDLIREEHVLSVLNQLRYADLSLGLIINFNNRFIKGDAIRRVVNGRFQ